MVVAYHITCNDIVYNAKACAGVQTLPLFFQCWIVVVGSELWAEVCNPPPPVSPWIHTFVEFMQTSEQEMSRHVSLKT